MEIIHETPTAEAFVSLSTHQSQTPESFFNGPPVLYHHSPSAKLSIQSSELALAPALTKLFEGSSATQNGSAPVVNGDTPPAEDQELSVEGIDVWVTSEYNALTLLIKKHALNSSIEDSSSSPPKSPPESQYPIPASPSTPSNAAQAQPPRN